MLHGSIWDKLPRYAFPVAATAILEKLFNASDIAVVGNFTGEYLTAAVAAVGANSSLIALGANVVIANAMGRGDREAVSRAVHSSIVVALVGGVIVALLGELIAEPVLTVPVAQETERRYAGVKVRRVGGKEIVCHNIIVGDGRCAVLFLYVAVSFN